MGELGKYKEEVLFTNPFEGNITTRRGETKFVKSVKGKIGNEDFILTSSQKGIWIKMRKKGWENKFILPISQMYNVRKLVETVKGQERVYIVYEMTKGLHRSATFGKKKQDGSPMFEPKMACSNCKNYSKKEGNTGYNKPRSGSSGRSI